MDVFFDLLNGTSGDMLVGALLSLGAREEKLKENLKSLEHGGFEIEIDKNPINKFTAYKVILNHNHSIKKMNVYNIIELIELSGIDTRVKVASIDTFRIAAIAGAKAHNCAVENFFFHERGAADSIADIVGFYSCYFDLNISNVYRTKLMDGYGKFQTKNGKEMSVPVPAVREIIETYLIKVTVNRNIQGELITPTGASIMANIAPNQRELIKFSYRNYGVGVGTRLYNPRPYLKVYELVDIEV